MRIENVTELPISPDSQSGKPSTTEPLVSQSSSTTGQDLNKSSALVSGVTANIPEKTLGKAEENTHFANQEEVKAAVERLKEHVQNLDREFHFNVDKETGDIVVKVVNPENNQVIRQIPSEELLKLVQRLEQNKGALLRETA